MPDASPATTTFLFTDIAGSTRLWAEHRDAMSAALARHDALLRAAVEEHGGSVFKTVGDAVCAAFPVPVGAITAAITGQRALAAEDWSDFAPDLPPLAVRMAIHTGVAETRDSDWFGQPLNRVARLLAIGHGGQVLVSRATEALVADHLPAGVALRDLGEHRLKDLARPERVFQVVAPELEADFPPLASVDARPNNLPLLPYPLLGRAGELADLRALLTAGDTRLVTLTGPGGTGKTRLALAAAAECLDAFRHGAFFVDLAPLTDPALLPASIAAALGLVESPGEPLAVTVTAWLAHKRLLLVLDNFEQILGAGAFVAELLAACADLRILVTSRAPLRLRWERELPLAPMAVPERPEQATPETVTRYAAVELFVQRATDARPDFRVTAENAAAIAQVCARLDGLPLAIELAAARVRALTPGAILDRLGQQLRLLAGGARDLPERQQTMRAAIAWSYDLLPAGQQRLFRWLAVFVGGWTLEAAEAVCGAGDGDTAGGGAEGWVDVWDGLPALVEQSLVRQMAGPGGEPRYTMLETIRAYGLEQLAAAGELDAARERHAAYFAERARVACYEEPFLAAPALFWRQQFGPDLESYRAALTWLADDNPALGLLLVSHLVDFWGEMALMLEAGRWAERLVANAGEVPPAVRAATVMVKAHVAHAHGDFRNAESSFRLAAETYDQTDDGLGRSRALYMLAWEQWQQGRPDDCNRLMDEAIAVAAACDCRSVQVFGARGRVSLASDAGQVTALWSEYLATRRRFGLPTDLDGDDCNELAFTYLLAGDLDSADRFLDLGLRWFDQHHVPPYATILDTLGRVRLTQGRLDDAHTAFRQVLEVAEGAKYGGEATQWGLDGLAAVARRQGALTRAATLRAAAAALRASGGKAIPTYEQADHAAETATLRAALGDAAFEAAWARGLAMTTDEAVEFALAVTGDDDLPDEP